jgi:hypothetical protein
LLQHARNPVDWYPWGAEALEKARTEDKPIFLSIGYAACHWCHVMAHESFEHPETAAVMNEHFINIKVDREERPDLDAIYMQAVVAMTGQGGWPLSVFLTPVGQPFFGGTYFPPTRRYNLPSFREILLTIARLWQAERTKLLESARQITELIQKESSPLPTHDQQLDPQVLDQAAMQLTRNYDWKNGGWGSAPKFPQPMAIEFLLRRAARRDSSALQMAEHALKAMARGGMYDVIGGGFARYSVDERWHTPHFEKMLYDNAQLASVYLHVYLLTKDPFYRRVCEETLDFVLREMTHADGGFFSSLDADSEGEEGKFYLWSLAEIQAALPTPQDVALFCAAYDVTESGNFEGRNILQRALAGEQLARKFDLAAAEVPARLASMHARLLEARGQRVRPGTDDKVLVAWNAWMMSALAEAGRYLKQEKYTRAATQNAAFLLEKLYPSGALLRSWRAGQARHTAYLEDYAALILGLLALYQSSPDLRWFQAAQTLGEAMIDRFADPQGGFFDTSADHERLLLRPRDLQDNATPSGNALAAMALLQMAAYTGEGHWRDRAERMLAGMQPLLARYPTGFAQWLAALDFAVGPSWEAAILGDPDSPAFQDLTEALWGGYRPSLVAALSNFPPAPGAPALLAQRALLQGQPTAYLCQQFLCKQPVTNPAAFSAQLEDIGW